MIQVPEVVKSFSPKPEKSRNKGLLTSKGLEDPNQEESKGLTEHLSDSHSPTTGNPIINLIYIDKRQSTNDRINTIFNQTTKASKTLKKNNIITQISTLSKNSSNTN